MLDTTLTLAAYVAHLLENRWGKRILRWFLDGRRRNGRFEDIWTSHTEALSGP